LACRWAAALAVRSAGKAFLDLAGCCKGFFSAWLVDDAGFFSVG